MSQLSAHVVVSGRVQGVWFRESTRRRACELGVRGYVRNLSDGRVEAVFEGEGGAVREALDFVRHGPPQAEVSGVEIDEQSMGGDSSSYSGFHVR